MRMDEAVLGITESVCPECLRKIPAAKVAHGDRIYLKKDCPEHGSFQVLIWQGEPAYTSWAEPKIPSRPLVCATEVEKGCPFDCGLCPEHRQQTCCILLEITERCNLACPICFANSNSNPIPDPEITVIEEWYRLLLARGGSYNIQLSGGEPTVRDDLPEIISLGHSLGFNFIQLNTNGLRLAREPEFVQRLKEAGLNCVFLQFDGTREDIYQKVRGTALLELKKTAIKHCAEQEIGVVLVPTLVPGVNTDNIGEIIQFAVDNLPNVRGVHFQPISYFGRYPELPSDAQRITIPEIMRAIELQTHGKIPATSFLPPRGENAYCSFHGNFILMPDGELRPWAGDGGKGSCCKPRSAAEGSRRKQEFVAKQWSAPSCCSKEQDTAKSINVDSLDAFLARIKTHTLSISSMAFQDVWNLDLERLRDCPLHVLSPEQKIIPFCAYNLTDKEGRTIYRRQQARP